MSQQSGIPMPFDLRELEIILLGWKVTNNWIKDIYAEQTLGSVVIKYTKDETILYAEFSYVQAMNYYAIGIQQTEQPLKATFEKIYLHRSSHNWTEFSLMITWLQKGMTLEEMELILDEIEKKANPGALLMPGFRLKSENYIAIYSDHSYTFGKIVKTKKELFEFFADKTERVIRSWNDVFHIQEYELCALKVFGVNPETLELYEASAEIQ